MTCHRLGTWRLALWPSQPCCSAGRTDMMVSGEVSSHGSTVTFPISFHALYLLSVFPCLLHMPRALRTKHFWTWLQVFGCPSSIVHLLLLLPFWQFPAPAIWLLPPACFAALLHSQLLPSAEIGTIWCTSALGRQNHWLQEIAIWFWVLGAGMTPLKYFCLNGFSKFTSPEGYRGSFKPPFFGDVSVSPVLYGRPLANLLSSARVLHYSFSSCSYCTTNLCFLGPVSTWWPLIISPWTFLWSLVPENHSGW